MHNSAPHWSHLAEVILHKGSREDVALGTRHRILEPSQRHGTLEHLVLVRGAHLDFFVGVCHLRMHFVAHKHALSRCGLYIQYDP